MMHRGVYFNRWLKSYGEIKHNDTFTFSDCVGIEVIFNATGGNIGLFADIVDKRDRVFVEGGKGFTLRTRNNHSLLEFGIGDGNNYVFRGVQIEQNKTMQVFVQYSISEEKLQMFVDGELKINEDIAIGDFNTSVPIAIGKMAYKNAEFFNGIVALVRIYKDRFFTPEEVEYNMKHTNNPISDGLIAWIPFVENMGVIAKDYSGNNNHARLYNCKWVSRARRGMYFDNGGMKFDSGLNIDCNYCSVVAVFAIETLAKGGDIPSGRNLIVRPTASGKLSLFNNPLEKELTFTNYDGSWKGVRSNIELEAGQIYTGVGIMNNNEGHIYLASNGVIIDHNNRDDLGDCGVETDETVYVGSKLDGTWKLHGEVLAVMIYDRPITEDEIKQISDLGWFNPPRNGLISWILFDGLREGDEVKDLITGAVGEPIGTPKFVIRKPKRVLTR